MAKKAYVGVSNKARRVKKIYIGISGKARKVRKGYIGVAGKARLFFMHGTLKYHEGYTNCTTTNLRTCAASNDSYAFVTDGQYVNSFNSQLVCSVASSLSAMRYDCDGATAAGQYAVFGGDSGGVTSSSGTTVDAYDKSGTRTTATSFITKMRGYVAGHNDAYAVFGPGEGSTYEELTTVHLYNSSLTQTTTNSNSHHSKYCVSNNGAYAILYSGKYGSSTPDRGNTHVDAIDTSGTVTALTDLSSSYERIGALGARAGNYALCAGGYVQGYDSGGQATEVMYKNVVTYNLSLTKSNATELTQPISLVEYDRAASAEEFAIIPTVTRSSYVGYYDTYNPSLVKTTYNRTGSSGSQYAPAATSFRQYALFFRGTGNTSGSHTSVDVFEVD